MSSTSSHKQGKYIDLTGDSSFFECEKVLIPQDDTGEGIALAIRELDNAMCRLEQSNREIEEFDPNGADAELVQAISENVEAIEKKRQRRATLFNRLKLTHPHLSKALVEEKANEKAARNSEAVAAPDEEVGTRAQLHSTSGLSL